MDVDLTESFMDTGPGDDEEEEEEGEPMVLDNALQELQQPPPSSHPFADQVGPCSMSWCGAKRVSVSNIITMIHET